MDKLTKLRINNILVIYNPAAGWRRRALLRRFVIAIGALGKHVIVRETGGRGDAERYAQDAVRQGFDCVVAAGGDGTINEVVNGLVRHGATPEIPLAVLPLGTANVFALELGLTRDVRYCAEIVAEGQSKPVHLGMLNDRLFVQMAGVGFDAQVVSDVSPSLKRRFGKLAYIVKTLTGFFRYRLPNYTVFVDGIAHHAASAVIANGKYYGGKFSCAPDASVTDQNLHVCLFKSRGGWNALRYASGLVRGRLDKYHDVEILKGRFMEIGGGPGHPVQADGDVVAHLPARVRGGGAVIPVLVPS